MELHLLQIHLAATLLCELICAATQKTKSLLLAESDAEKFAGIISSSLVVLQNEVPGVQLSFQTLQRIFKQRDILAALSAYRNGKSFDFDSIVSAFAADEEFYIPDSAEKDKDAQTVIETFFRILTSELAKEQWIALTILLRAQETQMARANESHALLECILSHVQGAANSVDQLLSMVAQQLPAFQLIDRKFVQERSQRSDPVNFYQGGTSWGNIFAGCDIPRHVYIDGTQHSHDQFIDSLWTEIGTLGVSLWAITAPAGEGKTTLLFRCAYDLYKKWSGQDARTFYIVYIDGRELDVAQLIRFYSLVQKPICILIDAHHTAEIARSLKHAIPVIADGGYPIQIILAARRSDWSYAGGWTTFGQRATSLHDVTLRQLSDPEIDALICSLERYGSLGAIGSFETNVERRQYVKRCYNNWLLVTLMEATHGRPFEQIVLNEYNSLPMDVRQCYLVTCLSHSHDVELPLDIMKRLFPQIPPSRLPSGVMRVTDWGTSKQAVVTRHRLIAEKVVERTLNRLAMVECMEQLLNGLKHLRTSDRRYFLALIFAMVTQAPDPDRPNRRSVELAVVRYFIDGPGATLVEPTLLSAKASLAKDGRLFETKGWSLIFHILKYNKKNADWLEYMLRVCGRSPALHFYYARALYLSANANALKDPRRMQKVSHHCKLARQLGLTGTSFLRFYAEFEFHEGRTLKGIRLLFQAIRQDPTDLRNDSLLTRLAGQCREPQSAKALIESLRDSIDLLNPDALRLAIKVFRANQEYADALNASAILEASDRLTLEDQLAYASCLADGRKEYATAIKIARTVASECKGNLRLLAITKNNMALWLDTLNPGAPECANYWQEAIEAWPNFPWAYICLGRFLAKNDGEADRAYGLVKQGLAAAEKAFNSRATLEAETLLRSMSAK